VCVTDCTAIQLGVLWLQILLLSLTILWNALLKELSLITLMDAFNARIKMHYFKLAFNVYCDRVLEHI